MIFQPLDTILVVVFDGEMFSCCLSYEDGNKFYGEGKTSFEALSSAICQHNNLNKKVIPFPDS